MDSKQGLDLATLTDEALAARADDWDTITWSERQEAATELDRRRYVALTAALDVGDGVHYCVGTDRYAATVVARTPATITIQVDEARNVATWPEQDWRFSRNEDGRRQTFTRRKDGAYLAKGAKSRGEGFLRIGRNQYLDPHF